MFAILLASRNVFLIRLMGLLTWYMVTLLYRHKIQSLCLQTTNLPPKASLEQRALQTILLHILFGDINFGQYYLLLKNYVLQKSGTVYVHILVAHSYTTVSPLLIISDEKHIINLFISMCERIVIIWLSFIVKFFSRWTNVLSPELWITAEWAFTKLEENVGLCFFCLVYSLFYICMDVRFT